MKTEILKVLSTLVSLVFVAISGTDVKPVESDDLFSLLHEGDRSIRFDDNYKDLIILIGNSGAGKTTVGLILTADQSELEAYDDEKADKILIRDIGGRIGADVVKSKTIFPELMINPENGAAFYDCPGFRDTRKRNASIDLANSIFIKKIADHANTVKVAMIVNHYSVSNGGAREDFLNLLESTLQLIKPIERFVNSIALVATKVAHVKSPKRTVQAIANHLISFKESVEDVVRDDEDVRRAKILLNALTVRLNGTYPKLCFTRVPTNEGLLSELPLMQSDREAIAKVIYDNLEYVPVTADDFGFTISPEADKLVVRMLDRLESNAAEQLEFLSSYYQQHFQALLSASPDPKELATVLGNTRLRLKEDLVALLANPKLSASSFVQILLDSIANRTIDFTTQAHHIVAAIEDDKKLLALLQHVSDRKLKIPQLLVQPIQRLIDCIEVLQDWLLLLTEVDNKLSIKDLPETKLESNETNNASAVDFFVNPSTWFQTLMRVSNQFNLEILISQDQIISIVHESTAVSHLNQIIGRVIETRWAHIELTLRKLSSDLTQLFLNDQSPHSRQNLKKILKVLQETMDDCVNDGIVTPEEILQHLTASLNTTLYEEQPAARSAITSLQDHLQILNLLQRANRKGSKQDPCAVYENLEELKQFLSKVLPWFDHVDNIASKVPINISAYDLDGKMLVNSSNSIRILSDLSIQFSLETPNNPEILQDNQPLQRHINQLLEDICAYSSMKISKAIDTAATAVRLNLGTKISTLVSLQDFISHVSHIKERFMAHRRPRTSNDTRNLAKFLDDQFQVRTTNETGCEIVELIQSSIPDFCEEYSLLTETPLAVIEDLLQSTFNWYEFLFALAQSLDSYEMQRDKLRYNVAKVAYWGQAGMPQGITVTEKNCKKFVKLASSTIKTWHGVVAERMCGTVAKLTTQSNETSPLDHLNSILTLTLKTPTLCDFNAGVTTAAGPYVKMSEALSCILAGSTHTERLVVLATHGFIFDKNFKAFEYNRGKTFDLIIISPNWISVASSISLNGKDSVDIPKAATGKPGNPGGNGGNFYGLARTFSGVQIDISTNGGDGGRGEDGGHGHLGNNGTFCGKYDCLISSGADPDCGNIYASSKWGHSVIEKGLYKSVVELKGSSASRGGRGKDSGMGGLGGNPGVIILNVLCNNNATVYEGHANSGLTGQGGNGGTGGLGGWQNKVTVVIEKHKERSGNWIMDLIGWRTYDCKLSETFTDPIFFRADSGEKGVSGSNGSNRQSTNPNNFVPSAVLGQYRAVYSSFISNQTDLFKKDNLVSFQNQLEMIDLNGSEDYESFC